MRRLIFSLLLLALAAPADARQDVRDTFGMPSGCVRDSASCRPGCFCDSLRSGVTRGDDRELTRYERHVQRRQNLWNALIPTQIVGQYAGNMGLFSIGMGWNYGRHRQWETQLLFGYLPKFNSDRSKATMTLKENFMPWRVGIGEHFMLEPLSCGLYVNSVFGHEFWDRAPKRYPDKYYPLLTTKVRFNVFVGQRLTLKIPESRRKFVKSTTLFYEFSTCDLYIRSMVMDREVTLWDIVGLSLGFKLQLQ